MPDIHTLLVANRGEIACRVIRTARALGLQTVAVHSEADRDALHVRMADRAVCIGPAPARDSYLRIDAVLEACRQTGAQAVHPGYGFLSESAEFSRACREAGLVFVGPPPEAIEALGNKSAGKLLARRIGVPSLPGYAGAEQSIDHLVAEARRIAPPLMIKAAAGGGGRGMRRCDDTGDEAALRGLLEAARSEAQASFGSGELLLERLVERARHIEIQVFGDTQGHYVHLGERDCSTQRRNQKILEEAPAPGMSAALRSAMGEAAIRLAREVGYVGAGTIEFLLTPEDEFFFLEMNTRLQVEHPVTEAVTGLDLVEWQLRVARGEALPLAQSDITWTGHAIEARLCAEDAFNGYVPQSGDLVGWQLPREARGVRVDHGLAEHASIPPHYDSMIAKVIASGADRAQALDRLRAALAQTSVFGVITNRDFLQACLSAPSFRDAELSTRWLTEACAAWTAPTPSSAWIATAAAWCVRRAAARWGDLGLWASRGARDFPLQLASGERQWKLRITTQADAALIVTGEDFEHRLEFLSTDESHLSLRLDGVTNHVRAASTGASAGWLDGFGHCAAWIDQTMAPPQSDRAGAGGRLTARMHGLVVKVAVQAGQTVSRGTHLLSIEAMKMEHRLEAGIDGVVTEIAVTEGVQVSPGKLLVLLEPLSA